MDDPVREGEQPAVKADIPDLSTRKRATKRPGVFWSWGSGGEGVSLYTLLGGDGDIAASRALEQLTSSFSRGLRAAVGGAAAAKSGAGGGLLAAAFIGVGGLLAGLFAWRHWIHHPRGSASYELGGISASVRPHPSLDSVRLRFAGESTGGAVRWARPWNEKKEPKDAGKPADAGAAKDAGASEDVAGPKEDDTDWNQVLGAAQADPQLAAMAGARLTGANGMTKQLAADFGSKSVFGSYKPAPLKQPKVPANIKRVDPSKTSALSRFAAGAKRYAVSSGRSVRRAFSPLAFAQLRLTNVLSNKSATTTDVDTQKSLASDAFDQAATSGQTIAMGSGAMSDSKVPIVPAMGGTAPNITDSGVDTPTDPGAVNATPYQSNLNQAMNMIQQAAMLKMLGMLMLAIGAALVATGWPPTVVAGIALILAGIMMILQAMQLAAAAKAIGDQMVKAMQGQQTQSNIVTQCADQASNLGTTTANCKHDQAPDMHTNIRQDTDKERAANWTWDSENGSGNANSNSNASSSKK